MAAEGQKYIFISHSNRPGDYELTNRLFRFLTAHNLCCWYDGLIGAGNWQKQIYSHLVDASLFIFVASKNSLVSREVKNERTMMDNLCQWSSLSAEEKDSEIEKQMSHIYGGRKTIITLAIDDYINQPDIRKGGMGYITGDCCDTCVYLSKFDGDEDRAFMQLLRLIDGIPDAVSRLSNNPTDFVYDESGSVLVKYNGSDGVVVIPEYVTDIALDAFRGRKKIERIVLHRGVKTIGNRAFLGCSDLCVIDGAESVTECGLYPVDGTLVESAAANGYSFGCVVTGGEVKSDELIINEKALTIADGAFMCGQFKKLTLNEGLVRIGSRAFAGCSGLEELIVPSSVKSIGSNAFKGCYNLKTVTLDKDLYQSADDAFDNTVNIKFREER